MVETKRLYEHAIKLHPEIQALERRKIISGLSGSVSTLKSKKKILVIEESVSGVKLYGLADWFYETGHPKDLYYVNLIEDNFEPKLFGLTPKHQHRSYRTTVEEDDLPF